MLFEYPLGTFSMWPCSFQDQEQTHNEFRLFRKHQKTGILYLKTLEAHNH